MNFGILIPIVAIMATAGIVMQYLKYLQSRHSAAGGNAAEARENARLAEENAVLRRTVDRLEQRMAVLERIATDPAERTAREIEALR
jgi:cell division protein FtsB